MAEPCWRLKFEWPNFGTPFGGEAGCVAPKEKVWKILEPIFGLEAGCGKEKKKRVSEGRREEESGRNCEEQPTKWPKFFGAHWREERPVVRGPRGRVSFGPQTLALPCRDQGNSPITLTSLIKFQFEIYMYFKLKIVRA